jgi:hypothetical protein
LRKCRKIGELTRISQVTCLSQGSFLAQWARLCVAVYYFQRPVSRPERFCPMQFLAFFRRSKLRKTAISGQQACQRRDLSQVVRSGGLEPPLRLKNSDLNAARLPIPPRPHDLDWPRLSEGLRRPQDQFCTERQNDCDNIKPLGQTAGPNRLGSPGGVWLRVRGASGCGPW